MLSFKLDELSVWEKLRNSEIPVVIYGTGNGADKVIDAFEKKGITLSGVTASSGFVRERSFRGFPVKPISFFEEKFENFIIAVAFGSSRPEVINSIEELSRKRRVLVPVVPVIGTELFDREYLEKNEKEIEEAYSLLADEESRRVYRGYINFLFGGELEELFSITSPEAEAYEKILKIGKNETMVDIGAYRGDTVEKFLHYCGGAYKEIIAAEPDKKTFSKLMANCAGLKGFRGENVAVTDIDGVVPFSFSAGRQSRIGGDEKIKSKTLSSLCNGASPDYIKIDSEGCELEILGASPEILREHRPKLNIAAYHKNEDVFRLPILIKSIQPEYRIQLRHHPNIPAWDTIYYCV